MQEVHARFETAVFSVVNVQVIDDALVTEVPFGSQHGMAVNSTSQGYEKNQS